MSRPKPKTKLTERDEILLQIVKNCSAVAHALLEQPTPRKPPQPDNSPKLSVMKARTA